MSIINLTTPSNETNVFCENLNAENIVCQNIIAAITSFFNLQADTLITKHIFYSQSPPIDNAVTDFIVYDSSDGELKINNTMVAGSVTNGQNLGTVPVFHDKLGTVLRFNGLDANAAQGCTLTPAPGPGGDIVINNTFLDQDVKTSAQPSFVSVTAALAGQGSLKIGTGGINGTTTTIVPGQSGDIAVALPTTACILVGRDTTDTLSSKNFIDSSTAIVDLADNTKRINFDAEGTTGTTTTILSSQTSNRIITLPDVTTTLVGTDNVVTLTNKNLNDATCRVTDNSDPTKTIEFNAGGTTGTSTQIACAQTANRVVTMPDATTTLVGTNNTVSLTNKTYSGPVLSNVTTNTLGTASIVGLGFHDGTGVMYQLTNVASTNSAQSLTNKSVTFTNGGSSLNYYESANTTLNFSGVATVNGVSLYYERLGRNVTIQLFASGDQAALALTIWTSTALPASIRPSTNIDTTITVKDNSVWQQLSGRIVISTAGVITISKTLDPAFADFTSAGNAAWAVFTASWIA